MTTDATNIDTESEDYKAGYEAGKEALKAEIEAGTRSAIDLLKLESWSCLSDAEVRTLIEYHEETVLASDRANAEKITAQLMTETVESTMANVCADTSAMLKYITDSMTNYQGVEPVSVASYLESVQEV